MSRIESVTTEHIHTHLAGDDFVTTYGKEPTIRHHIIVKIKSIDGLVGIGEACPLPFTLDDDPGRIRHEIEDVLTPFLIGKDALDPIVFAELTSRFPNLGGTARTGVDLALYDLVGKIRNLPVYDLLGDRHRKRVEIAGVLGMGTPESIAREAAYQFSRGMRSVKIKVGLDVERDVETLRLVRNIVGYSAKIRADANAGYSMQQAMKAIQEFHKLDLEYLEQPLAPDNYEGMSQLRKAGNVPIMADESLYSYADAQKLIRYDAADFFGLKLIKHGGIYQSRRIAQLAEENDIECVIISPWETQIGISGGIHLAVASSNFNHAHEIAAGSLEDDPFFGLEEHLGEYRLPHGPGLGINIRTRK
jgi:L-alanine-DL-glutamate epimerase-like enolase superfamily enzyme